MNDDDTPQPTAGELAQVAATLLIGRAKFGEEPSPKTPEEAIAQANKLVELSAAHIQEKDTESTQDWALVEALEFLEGTEKGISPAYEEFTRRLWGKLQGNDGKRDFTVNPLKLDDLFLLLYPNQRKSESNRRGREAVEEAEIGKRCNDGKDARNTVCSSLAQLADILIPLLASKFPEEMAESVWSRGDNGFLHAFKLYCPSFDERLYNGFMDEHGYPKEGLGLSMKPLLSKLEGLTNSK